MRRGLDSDGSSEAIRLCSRLLIVVKGQHFAVERAMGGNRDVADSSKWRREARARPTVLNKVVCKNRQRITFEWDEPLTTARSLHFISSRTDPEPWEVFAMSHGILVRLITPRWSQTRKVMEVVTRANRPFARYRDMPRLEASLSDTPTTTDCRDTSCSANEIWANDRVCAQPIDEVGAASEWEADGRHQRGAR